MTEINNVELFFCYSEQFERPAWRFKKEESELSNIQWENQSTAKTGMPTLYMYILK